MCGLVSSSLRKSNVARLGQGTFDVLVLGGGINGAVTAACLSARGLKVALVDRGDFAGFTSQHSSNLAWGGIKYMETYEFGLVWKLCGSRNDLIRAYPSTVQEIRFFTTHAKGFRHGLWKLVMGTWVYWLFGRFFTKTPRLLSREDIAKDEPIVSLEGMDGGFEYSDAYLYDNDARFVWNFVRSALDHGCVAVNYAESQGSTRKGDVWETEVRDLVSGETKTVRSKVLVNACGPFVDDHNEKSGVTTGHKHVFSKGIHLIVPRLTKSKRVLTFFADDGRLFFVIPMGPRTCIGTTDTRVDTPYSHVTDEDRAFVLENINKRLRLEKPLTTADVVAERCGVRPLVVKGSGGDTTDWLQLSRKHAVDIDDAKKHVSIYGGKLTDCLNVGQELADACTRLGLTLPYPKRVWYGEPRGEAREAYLHQAKLMGLDDLTAKSSSEKLSRRLWRRYGAAALPMLEEIRRDPRMAEVLIENAEYLRCEIEHAARREMVVKLDDFLRRRSKISLVVSRETLREAQGLTDACRILFGDEAEARLEEYFRETEAEAIPRGDAPERDIEVEAQHAAS
jgi:glycerol-3-phosphate dehydrogenase